MSLTPAEYFAADSINASETIVLEPESSDTPTLATFGSVFYGRDGSGAPRSVPLSADRQSFTFFVLTGMNALTMTLVSPNPDDEVVLLTQQGVILANPTVHRHSAVSILYIQGN